MAVPNFLIIGDVKAGSTSLWYYLRQHPEVCMPDEKELRYFAYDEQNPYHVRAHSSRVKTYSEYLRHFEKCGNAKAVGEASPNYLRSPGAANRIKAKLPGVRLIVCLRNPADRLYSTYLMNYREGYTKKPFDEELFGRDAAFIKAQFYFLDLKRYFDRFAHNQIKIVLFDDLRKDAGSVVKYLYEFLDVDKSFAPSLAVQNEGGIPKSLLWYKIFVRGKSLIGRFGAPPAALRQLSKIIERRSLRKTPLDPHIRRKILEVCEEDIRATQDLIGRDLSAWLR
jgi:hypothetical protein